MQMLDYLLVAQKKEKDAQEKSMHEAQYGIGIENQQNDFIALAQKAGLMKKQASTVVSSPKNENGWSDEFKSMTRLER